MLFGDGNGLPIEFLLASASPHEVKLAVPTLEIVPVPRRRGVGPSSVLRSWLPPAGPTTAGPSGAGCAHGESSARLCPIYAAHVSDPSGDVL